MLTFLVFLMLIGLIVSLAVHFGYWDKWILYTKKTLSGAISNNNTEENENNSNLETFSNRKLIQIN